MWSAVMVLMRSVAMVLTVCLSPSECFCHQTDKDALQLVTLEEMVGKGLSF